MGLSAFDSEARHAGIVQAERIAGRSEVVGLEEALLALLHPIVAVEAVGVEACHDLCLPVERGPSAAYLSEETETRLVPRVGDDARLAFGTHRAEEVDGFVVRVVQSDRHDDVSRAYI